jgi:hypothetical protein
MDRAHNTLLAFAPHAGPSTKIDVDDPSLQRVSIGVIADGSPWLGFTGLDGRSRVRLYLSEFEKPILLLEDKHNPRISLGISQSDVHDPDDDDWLLEFLPDRAVLGMTRDPVAKTMSGKLWLNNKSAIK